MTKEQLINEIIYMEHDQAPFDYIIVSFLRQFDNKTLTILYKYTKAEFNKRIKKLSNRKRNIR
jgi:hypothetical protein